MVTSLPTNTFWPNEHPRPIRAPPQIWTQCQTRDPSPISAPSSTIAVGCILTAISIIQGQRDPPPIAGGQVSRDQHLQRFEAVASVSSWFRFATQHTDDVIVIERVPE